MLNKHGILWDFTVWPWVQNKISEMDAAGFGDVKVTFVWSMGVLDSLGKNWDFLKKMHQKYTKRWVWAVNPYSIWDKSLWPSSSNCQKNTDVAVDIVYLKNIMTVFRNAVSKFTGNTDDPLWIGETGWASPFTASQTSLKSACPYWASPDALRKYYQNFLEWDGSLNGGVKGLDYVFYFTNRDASDFGDAQPFGLVDKCSNPDCKLQENGNKTHDVIV